MNEARDLLSWLVALVCVLAALVVLRASPEMWLAFLGIAVVIVLGLLVSALARRRRVR